MMFCMVCHTVLSVLICCGKVKGSKFIYWSFYNTGLHNEMQVVAPLYYSRKKHFYVEVWRMSWELLHPQESSCSLVLQQRILIYRLPDGRRVNSLLQGWVFLLIFFGRILWLRKFGQDLDSLSSMNKILKFKCRLNSSTLEVWHGQVFILITKVCFLTMLFS